MIVFDSIVVFYCRQPEKGDAALHVGFYLFAHVALYFCSVFVLLGVGLMSLCAARLLFDGPLCFLALCIHTQGYSAPPRELLDKLTMSNAPLSSALIAHYVGPMVPEMGPQSTRVLLFILFYICYRCVSSQWPF